MDVSGALQEIEKCIFVDPGNRGISKMWTHGCLSEIVKRVMEQDRVKPSYVLTGFCCKGETSETDGPLGSEILCSVLRAIGFNTFLLTDRPSSRVVIAAAGDCPVLVTDDPSHISDVSFIISIERPGRSIKSGKYCTMTARDITNVTAPLDRLFPMINGESKPYLTIAVGDGGNEVGTGKIAEQVKENVSKGDEICVTSGCDILVIAGVSNWGAIAIAAALALSTGNKEHIQKYISLSDRQPDILDQMIKAGSYDGCTGKCELSVDGMPYSREHTTVANSIKSILQKFL